MSLLVLDDGQCLNTDAGINYVQIRGHYNAEHSRKVELRVSFGSKNHYLRSFYDSYEETVVAAKKLSKTVIEKCPKQHFFSANDGQCFDLDLGLNSMQLRKCIGRETEIHIYFGKGEDYLRLIYPYGIAQKQIKLLAVLFAKCYNGDSDSDSDEDYEYL